MSPTLSDSCTVDGSGTGTFTSQLAGLKSGTRYFVRAYATNAKGTWYGNSVEFTTLTTVPELTTAPVGAISSFSAASCGTVLHNGGNYVIARGVCWSISHLPTVNDAKTVDWSSTGYSSYAKLLVIEPLNAFGHSSARSYGYSVRCIK